MGANSEQNCGSAQDSKKRGKIPYWMKNVQSTPDLVLRYQVRTKEVEEALKSDLRVLKEINQVWHISLNDDERIVFFDVNIYFLLVEFSWVW